ncbi:MAG: phosphoribosyl-ATP diphosphatase [Paracoccaceae bacterium]
MTLEELFDIVEERANASPDESWTARLLSQGPEKCAEKFGEEAVEAIIEAAKGNKAGLIKESADDELTSRQFQSGLAEKAARSVKK